MPPPLSTAIYDLFDGLILISEGKTIYLGPADRAVGHFAKNGFPCPPLYNQVLLSLPFVRTRKLLLGLPLVRFGAAPENGKPFRDRFSNPPLPAVFLPPPPPTVRLLP